MAFPQQYGLYGSFLGCIMYIFIGSCKDVPMGPTAIVSLLTYQVVKGAGPAYATLLCFLSGVIQLIMGISGLGEYSLRKIPISRIRRERTEGDSEVNLRLFDVAWYNFDRKNRGNGEFIKSNFSNILSV